MRIALRGLGATLTILPCLYLIAAGQNKGAAAPSVEAMRDQANKNARALATAVQGRAVRTGAYDNTMTLYTKDLGGSFPINPCTGTKTGYTMTVSKDRKASTVAASAGAKCGKWAPRQFHLSL